MLVSQTKISRCVELMELGYTYDEIAKKLGISKKTVSSHISIARKHGMTNERTRAPGNVTVYIDTDNQVGIEIERQAKLRGMSVRHLLNSLIHVIVTDNLFDAVLGGPNGK